MSNDNVYSDKSRETPKAPKKRAIVRNVQKLEPGVILDMTDFHIACADPQGNMYMTNADVYEMQKGNDGYEITPGAYRVTPKSGLEAIKFSDNVFYETETSRQLMGIFNTFRKNLHVYDELDIKQKKRGVLLGSVPGIGKSSTINFFCRNLVKTELTACFLYIDSQDVDYEIVQSMFRRSKPESVDFVVLIIEDIGGNDLTHRQHNISSTLLNFLDGSDGLFQIPTLVVGTTNYLDELSTTLSSRPGRFDEVLEVKPPAFDECVYLVESFIKRPLVQSEKESLRGKEFTPAYLRECVIRHRLRDISIEEAAEELGKQKEAAEKKRFANRGRAMGFDED